MRKAGSEEQGGQGDVRTLTKSALWGLVAAVVIKSLIRGNVPLLLKHFSLSDSMNEFNFLLLWYLGSLFGAVVFYFFSRIRGHQEKVSSQILLVLKQNRILLPLALSAWFGFALTYNIYHVGAIVVVQPVLAAAEAVVPVFVGLFFFDEAGQILKLERAGRLALWSCFMGTALVIVNFL